MKRTNFSALLTALSATVLLASGAPATQAQTWQTVDDFQSSAGLLAAGSDITTDPAGVVYAVGGASLDANDTQRLPVVSASANQGGDWTPLLEASQRTYDWEHYRAVASDPSGRMFVGGDGRNATWPSGAVTWFIRERAPGSTAWATTDSLPGDNSGCADIAIHPLTGDVYAGGSSATLGRMIRKRAAGTSTFNTVFYTGPSDIGSVWSVAFHPDGSVFGVGDQVDSATRRTTWVVQKSAIGELGTWQTVDTFQTSEWSGITAGGCLVTTNGVIYVAGNAYSSKLRATRWVVRTSTDGGATWTISDNFTYGGSNTPHVFEIAQDSKGNIFVCGQSADRSGKLFWIVRKGAWTTSTVKGKTVTSFTWSTSDAYQLAPGMAAWPLGITADASGNLFTCGRAQDASGVEHFIVRKLPAQ